LTELRSPARPLELGRRRLALVRPLAFVVVVVLVGLGLAILAEPAPRLVLGGVLVLVLVIDAVLAFRGLAADRVDFEMDPPPQAVIGEILPSLMRARAGRYPLSVETLWLWPTRTIAVDSDSIGVVDFPARSRGRIGSAVVDLGVVGPFGFVRCRRRARAWFGAPIDVAPPPVRHTIKWPPLPTFSFGLTETSPGGQEIFRGVREYVAGDPRRIVHWKATAHHGRLMVKEADGNGMVALRVVLQLPTPSTGAEDAVSRAYFLIEQARRQHWRVVLVTREPRQDNVPVPVDELPGPEFISPYGGPVGVATATVQRPIGSKRELLQRLASAGFGEPDLDDWNGAQVTVSPWGEKWM
jgi:uncharacterized protein (DUF58 family)